jgi:hypothetical protein
MAAQSPPDPNEGDIVTDQSAPWPKQAPASYFSSIVGHLESDHEMGPGHANASRMDARR